MDERLTVSLLILIPLSFRASKYGFMMTAHAFGMVNVTSAFIAPKLLTAKAKEEAIPSGWGYLSSSKGYLLNPFILIFDRNLEPKTTDRPPFSMEAHRAFWGKILSRSE